MLDNHDHPLYVKSLEKGLAILQIFESAYGPLTLTEISNQTEFGVSATQRYLHTLERLGFIERVFGTRRYRPALNIVRLGYIYNRLGILPNIGFPILKRLSEKFGEISWLCTLGQFDIIKIISNVETMSAHTYPTLTGSSTNIPTSAAGRAILSGFPAMEVVGRVFSYSFKTFTSKTLIDPKNILGEIELARINGFSLVEGEEDLETFSVAAPIFNSRSQPIAAIEILAPRKRWKWRKDRIKLARATASAAEKASLKLKKIGAL